MGGVLHYRALGRRFSKSGLVNSLQACFASSCITRVYRGALSINGGGVPFTVVLCCGVGHMFRGTLVLTAAAQTGEVYASISRCYKFVIVFRLTCACACTSCTWRSTSMVQERLCTLGPRCRRVTSYTVLLQHGDCCNLLRFPFVQVQGVAEELSPAGQPPWLHGRAGVFRVWCLGRASFGLEGCVVGHCKVCTFGIKAPACHPLSVVWLAKGSP